MLDSCNVRLVILLFMFIRSQIGKECRVLIREPRKAGRTVCNSRYCQRAAGGFTIQQSKRCVVKALGGGVE